jgi:hypothetical protein
MGRRKKTAHSSSGLKSKSKPQINDREPHLRPAFLVVWYEGEERRGKFFDNENAAHCYRVSKIVDSVAADNAHEPHEEADMALDMLKQAMLYGSGNDGAGERRDEIFVSPVIDPKEAAALQRKEFAKEDKEFNERIESSEQRKINETKELLKSDLGVRLGSGLEALLEQKPPPPPDVVYAYAKTGEVPGPDWTWDQCAVWEAVREEFSTMKLS